jgi:hypothetical protein
MSIHEAMGYHLAQVETFAATDADMVAAFTMNYVEEAVGIALAARQHSIPLALSFTLETDGKLPSGQSLVEAIERVDAESDEYPAYYMINCAHPSHFADVLDELGQKVRRVRGLRANASRRSHAELDASTDLDAGDPLTLGAEYRALQRSLRLSPSSEVAAGRITVTSQRSHTRSAREHRSQPGALAAFKVSIAATRRLRSSCPICSPERPVRSSGVRITAATALRAAAKYCRCG